MEISSIGLDTVNAAGMPRLPSFVRLAEVECFHFQTPDLTFSEWFVATTSMVIPESSLINLARPNVMRG